MKHLVAVYGSLRKGMHNHPLLSSSGTTEPMGVDRIPLWDMYSLGAYPLITKGTGSVVVELYNVTDDTMRALDRLEGFPHFYNRTQVATEKGPAWIYFIQDGGNASPVESGDWVEYKKNGGR